MDGQDGRNGGQAGTGPFAGFVLLGSSEWDPRKLREDLRADWGIDAAESGDALTPEGESMVWTVDGRMVAVSLMPAPVPNGEAEQNAANNFLWPGAVEAARAHKAHILVAVLGGDDEPMEAGRLLVKLCASCLRQPGATGVYTSGTVFQPEFYRRAAEDLRDDPAAVPVLDLIYFGVYRGPEGLNAYTYGMGLFGLDELEVVGSGRDPSDLYGFLFNVAHYVLTENVRLRDGETIGFSEKQKLPITRSQGVSVDGMSLKIGY